MKTLTIWFLLLFSSVTSSLGPEGQGPKSGVLRRIVSCNEPADDDDGVGEHVAVIVSITLRKHAKPRLNDQLFAS